MEELSPVDLTQQRVLDLAREALRGVDLRNARVEVAHAEAAEVEKGTHERRLGAQIGGALAGLVEVDDAVGVLDQLIEHLQRAPLAALDKSRGLRLEGRGELGESRGLEVVGDPRLQFYAVGTVSLVFIARFGQKGKKEFFDRRRQLRRLGSRLRRRAQRPDDFEKRSHVRGRLLLVLLKNFGRVPKSRRARADHLNLVFFAKGADSGVDGGGFGVARGFPRERNPSAAVGEMSADVSHERAEAVEVGAAESDESVAVLAPQIIVEIGNRLEEKAQAVRRDLLRVEKGLAHDEQRQKAGISPIDRDLVEEGLVQDAEVLAEPHNAHVLFAFGIHYWIIRLL